MKWIKQLKIWVDGEPSTRRSFLNRVREELVVIHGDQQEQAVKEFGRDRARRRGALPVLRHNWKIQGQRVYDPCLLATYLVEEVNIKELLDGVPQRSFLMQLV